MKVVPDQLRIRQYNSGSLTTEIILILNVLQARRVYRGTDIILKVPTIPCSFY